MELGELHENRHNPLDYINTKTGNLCIRKEEKDKFGEVFTPNKLINTMLDKLPEDIWSNPHNKWLDPATGFGNFQLFVYARLMTGLMAVKPDPAARSEHIIRNMIFMVEFNKANCEVVEQIFGTASNLCCSSFLKPVIFKNHPLVRQFNVIIGNPPFNADQKHDGKKGGGRNLWPLFVEKSLDMMLVDNGYLTLVHPSLWRKPPSVNSTVKTLFHLMVHENHMKYLEIHSKLDGLRDFNVQTRYDFYVIQKRVPNTTIPAIDTTTIKDQTGVIHSSFDLSRWRFFLPNNGYERIEPLLLVPDHDAPASASASAASTSSPAPAPRVIFSRCQYGSDQSWVKPTPSEIYRFPVIHSTPKKGARVLWSSRCHMAATDTATDGGYIPMFGVPKVIFGESGINEVIIDSEGKYGMTQGAIGLPIDNDDGLQMKQALESSEFKTILDAMSFSNFRIDWRMFLYFRPDFYKKILT
jgi:hypothetical protein